MFQPIITVLHHILGRKVLAVAFIAGVTALVHATPVPYLDESIPEAERIEDALSRMTLDEKIALIHAQSKFSSGGCPRLGIPPVWFSDGPHGVRMEIEWDDWSHAGWTNDSCTAMPALTCLAATFNPSLAGEYGRAIGEEARYRGKDVLLGPGVNIYRTPLSGRNFEYMGEDPVLASAMVVPYIRGVQSNGVAACLKHFVLNNQEHSRSDINVVVDSRALNELYLPAFRTGVKEGGVWAVMGSYNKYGGVYCSHNDTLVNRILKDEWDFDGVFITDWGSAHDTRQAALNGLDMEMGSWTDGLTFGVSNAYSRYFMADPLKFLIQTGEISEKTLDDKVRRVLRLCFRTNMNRTRPWGSMHTQQHLETARSVSREGLVLLGNEKGLLPLKKGIHIAVIGENAVKSLSKGGGSSELKPKTEISPLEAIRNKFGSNKVTFSLGYASGEPDYSRELPSGLDADSLISAAVETARRADVVVYVGGLNKNYRQDCEGEDRADYSLPYGQNRLIDALVKANPKIVVVIVSGNAVDMQWEERAGALIQHWYPGSVGNEALAEVLSGEISPSGKLPFSIPFKLEDCAAHSFGHEGYPGKDGDVIYRESILVGYRWHDTKGIPPRFRFGFGLGYSDFEYNGLTTDRNTYSPEDTISVTLTVTNKGKMKASETIMLYASQKRPKVLRPSRELKAFTKVHLLPGETRRISILVKAADLAYFDESTGNFVVDPGSYLLSTGIPTTTSKKKLKNKKNLQTTVEIIRPHAGDDSLFATLSEYD